RASSAMVAGRPTREGEEPQSAVVARQKSDEAMVPGKSAKTRVPEQHKWMCSVLRGHYPYYAVPTNSRALATFRHAVRSTWHRWLQRRSQRAAWTTEQRRAFDTRFPLPLPPDPSSLAYRPFRLPLTRG